MNLFSCPQCESVLFFENTVCTSCGQHVGYSVEARALVAVPADAGKAGKPFLAPAPGARSTRYLKCKNFSELDTCNWLVRASDQHAYCRSCRLTERIPDRLIRSTPAQAEFRELFGDDEQSYEAALQRHYAEGPPANWSERFVSAYATMHPWEDWAETWAHYLHMVDTLETAKNHGLSLRVLGRGQGRRSSKKVATDALAFRDYESSSGGWHALTIALNDLNRSMGVKDVYPFVLSPLVHDKLRFVHDVIGRSAARSSGSWLDWFRHRRAS